MAHALADLKSVSGTIGSYIFSPQQGMLAADVPNVFKQDRLAQTGRILARIFGAGRVSATNTRDVALYFAEMLVVVRELSDGVYLVVMCDPSLNISLLSMSLNLAMDDLIAMASGAGAPAAQGAAKDAAQTAAGAKPTLEVLREGDLGQALDDMELALAKVMGPMAKIIFNDALKVWMEGADPVEGNLNKLIDIVCTDLGDEAKAEKYKSFVADQFLGT